MHEKEYKTLYETRNLCKLNTLKRLEKHDKNPGHHTPILNDSSPSSVNSRRLVLKSEISPLIQQRLGYTFRKNREMQIVTGSENQRFIHLQFIHQKGEIQSSPRESYRTSNLA